MQTSSISQRSRFRLLPLRPLGSIDGLVITLTALGLALCAHPAAAEPLRVFTTVTDLASLAKEVGGEEVDVASMARGREDAHFLEARPSFIKELSRTDLFVQVGMEMEVGYVPLLLQNARNRRVLPGNPGFLDASSAITPLDVPEGTVDRSMGDVHPYGNPHYLLDPVNGLEVARRIADRLAQLRPEKKPYFDRRSADFRRRVGVALAGAELAGKYEVEKLAQLFEQGKLAEFLQQQGDAGKLGGWLAAMTPVHGTKVVDDHPIWTYFARRFGLRVVGHLEPRPGIPPTTSHLREIVERMKRDDVRLVLASAYYDPRHAAFVSEATGARVASLAHQVGARPGTDDYIAMIDYNVREVTRAAGQR